MVDKAFLIVNKYLTSIPRFVGPSVGCDRIFIALSIFLKPLQGVLPGTTDQVFSCCFGLRINCKTTIQYARSF
jgi:hypothetical protein